MYLSPLMKKKEGVITLNPSVVWPEITLPTYGLKSHFIHLKYVPFVFRNSLLLKLGVNMYFYSNFMSLSSQNKN